MKYCMHFQLYFNFHYHYLYPTHTLPTHLPTYHYLHVTYMLPTYYYKLLVGARGRRPLWSFISFIFSYLLLFIWPLPFPPCLAVPPCPALSGRPTPCPCHRKCSTPPPVPHNIWGNDKRWGIFCFYYLLITAVW